MGGLNSAFPKLALIGESRTVGTKSLGSVLPWYAVCSISSSKTACPAASRAARRLDAVQRSWPQAKECQVVKSMPWPGSKVWAAAVGNTNPTQPPQLGDPRGSRQRLLMSWFFRPPACCTGETLSRRWDMSCAAAHHCGWMRQNCLRKEKSKFETPLLAPSVPRERRPLWQSHEQSSFSLVVCLFLLLPKSQIDVALCVIACITPSHCPCFARAR